MRPMMMSSYASDIPSTSRSLGAIGTTLFAGRNESCGDIHRGYSLDGSDSADAVSLASTMSSLGFDSCRTLSERTDRDICEKGGNFGLDRRSSNGTCDISGGGTGDADLNSNGNGNDNGNGNKNAHRHGVPEDCDAVQKVCGTHIPDFVIPRERRSLPRVFPSPFPSLHLTPRTADTSTPSAVGAPARSGTREQGCVRSFMSGEVTPLMYPGVAVAGLTTRLRRGVERGTEAPTTSSGSRRCAGNGRVLNALARTTGVKSSRGDDDISVITVPSAMTVSEDGESKMAALAALTNDRLHKATISGMTLYHLTN